MLIILSLLCNQLIMTSPFNNASLLQNHNAVAVSDSRKPVCDNKCSTAMHELIHAVLNNTLGTCIN